MKTFCYLLLFLCSLSLYAQEQNPAAKPPVIVTKLPMQTSFEIGKHQIKLLEVIEDSRCPKKVNCVWAGQAKVKIAIYKKEELLKELILTFGAQGIHPKNEKSILKDDTQEILAYNINPYPISGQQIDPDSYTLELIVK
ncbi:hypothetical protein [Aquimarina rhabdastrellae]